jgi:hypothetical protein
MRRRRKSKRRWLNSLEPQSAMRGRATRKVQPCAGAVVTVTVPPWACTSESTIDRPGPSNTSMRMCR